MEQLAKLLTEQLIKKGADYQKRDIYQYALEYFLSTIIGILGIITIATLSIGPVHLSLNVTVPNKTLLLFAI